MMKKNRVHILLFVKSNFHELLLTKEIQSRVQDSIISSTQSNREIIDLLETSDVDALIIDLLHDNQEDLEMIKEINLVKPTLPIIAIVDDNSEMFLRELFKLGVSEVLQKNETFYVAIPQLLKSVLEKDIPEEIEINQSFTESEHIKLTSRTLSHEINNPLMTILGISELILDNQFQYDRDLVKKIRTIQLSARRIQKSTHRMSHIKSPVYRKTPYGAIIDTDKSQISSKS